MIPIKDKKYMLNCQGLYDYNRYMGEGVFTGEVTDMEGETCYGFMIPVEKEICFFTKEEIIAEFSDDNQIRPSICDPENYPEDALQSQIDSEESPYCAKCDSCGETGCCPPINCEAVVCKYGEINLKDYNCFQDQWAVMYNALKEIADMDYGAAGWPDIAKNALNEVDKLWDKIYSKE
jgi:hypothetical protein